MLSFGVLKLAHSDANELVNVKVAICKLSLAAMIQVRIPGLLQRKKNETESQAYRTSEYRDKDNYDLLP